MDFAGEATTSVQCELTARLLGAWNARRVDRLPRWRETLENRPETIGPIAVVFPCGLGPSPSRRPMPETKHPGSVALSPFLQASRR